MPFCVSATQPACRWPARSTSSSTAPTPPATWASCARARRRPSR